MDRFSGRALRRSAVVFATLALALAGRSGAGRNDQLRPDLKAMALAAAERVEGEVALGNAGLVTIIDYSLPSSEKRLWVVERASGRVLWHELVAHGQGTGEDLARRFSNRDGSHQTSLGVFVTAGTYVGRNGYSLRLIGLEPGVNDHALERSIVIHGAPYVSDDFIRRHGRLGRSWGCPALRPEVARTLIDQIKGGSVVFAYYPEASWLAESPFLRSGPGSAAAITSAG